MGGIAAWSFASALALGSVGFFLSGELGERSLLLPGKTSDGHYQMELDCNACHGGPFAGESALQASCVRCHGPELEAAENSHPKSKFTDPRNADRVARLDARRCVSCHREHWPEGTREMGVSVQQDHCAVCHADIARERPSHAALPWSSCDNVGCHRFHDNRASYEELLVEHAGEAALGGRRAHGAERALGSAPPERPGVTDPPTTPQLSAADADAPSEHALDGGELLMWAASAHAQGGVNCKGCHEKTGAWSDTVAVAVCGSCHADERAGWVSGKHGLRAGLGLEPMRPELARQPMHPGAALESLSCTSCHGAHGFERQRAAADACQHCHADTHTQAYAASPHGRLWQDELAGRTPPGSGVSCATCHLPRVQHPSGRLQVLHNPNENLRPREKMIRGVCLECHGLSFSIDALADAALVERNFTGIPGAHVPSIDWAVARAQARPADAARPHEPGNPETEP
jgi:hypothetical protein